MIVTVVSDTSPICYLILIEAIELLPQIYGRVVIPKAVHNELSSSQAPKEVRNWLQTKPQWLTVQQIAMTSDDRLKQLDTGEREALLLAESMPADVLLIDETAGRRAAIEREIDIVGTLGVLGVANDIGLINFRQSIERLQTTSMWMSPKLIQNLLDKYD